MNLRAQGKPFTSIKGEVKPERNFGAFLHEGAFFRYNK
jgi:hypothetical protein